MGKTVRPELVFALNGARVELQDVDPQTTVLNYIRNETDYKGTKRGCGEGGCGSCVVLLSKYDPESKKVEEYTINSCLAPICAVDGCAITTTEGLKHGKEPHAVHTRLAEFHASQCGYCTPGMAVSIFSCLRNCSTRSTEEGGSPQPTVDEASKAIAGNICRCTGYRPILDVCKSFASDVDIEDLGVNTFWESSDDARAKKSSLKEYESEKDPPFPSFLETETGRYLDVTSVRPGEERAWRSASSFSEAFYMCQYERDEKKRDAQFVVGNTSYGVYKDFKPSVYIDISKVPGLQRVVRTDSTIEVGAAVSLSKLIKNLDSSLGPVFPVLAEHVRKVASQHVRNRASVGGNLMLAQKRGFASDVATILLGAGSQVTITSSTDSTTMDLEDFLAGHSLPQTFILECIHIPSWADCLKDKNEEVLFRTYRSSPRVNGNAVSSINAAFLAIVHTSTAEEGEPATSKVQQLRLAFGALGGPHAIRAERTEKHFSQKILSVDLLKDAVRTLREDILSSAKDDQLHTAEYRASVAVGYLFQFFKHLISAKDLDSPPQSSAGHVISNGSVVGNGSSNSADGNGAVNDGNSPSFSRVDDVVLDSNVVENGTHKDANVNGAVTDGIASGKSNVRSFGRHADNTMEKKGFAGKQSFPVSDEFYPVARPAGKYAAVLQASGEAVYVDDIPSPAGTLHAAFVSSKKALAKIKGLDASHALTSQGATSFISVRDIPPNGENLGTMCNFTGSRDKLFAEDTVGFVGQPIGVMVADTVEHAVQAAAKVNVEYEESIGQPILSLDHADAKKSFKTSFLASLASASVGDVLVKGDYRIDNVEVHAGGQYFFYMETQTALAVPDEDDCITVYSSNQSPEHLQMVLGPALGIPLHNVRVITRRLGGAFGGKNTRSIIVAVACALAAFKLKKPVRMTLDRNTDMEFAGGRHESKVTYTVEFNKDGKITSLESRVLMNGGFQDDYSDLMGMLMTKAMKCYNWSSWKHVTQVCRTNLPTRSLMRAPGEIQGNFFAESIIEHVASFLGLDSTKVREKNMHTHESAVRFYGPGAAGRAEYFTLPRVWHRLKDSSNFEARKLSVQEFNQKHMWVKRGISIIAIVYATPLSARLARVTLLADASVVVESGGTEMGQGLFTKVQQATAYGLSQLWGEKGAGKVAVSKIRVVQNDSISLANAGYTNAGTTSEGTCDAVMNACNILVENLKPVLVELQSKGADSPSFEDLVQLAKSKNVALSAQAQNTALSETEYIVSGACASEVEVDVLTGGVNILQSDILYDTGKSLNPAIDIGQIEGSFVQGIGYFVTEEIKWDENGVLITNGTWTYKPPTIDNIPHQFNVELLNSAADTRRILSSKTAGEPPLLLATSVHNAIRDAIRSARADLQHLAPAQDLASPNKTQDSSGSHFLMHSSATMEKVKKLCGLYNVDQYLQWLSEGSL